MSGTPTQMSEKLSRDSTVGRSFQMSGTSREALPDVLE